MSDLKLDAIPSGEFFYSKIGKYMIKAGDLDECIFGKWTGQ
jgi:hypothetical protein